MRWGKVFSERKRIKLMNENWSQENKQIQKLLSKEATFDEAVRKLLEFRNELFQQIKAQSLYIRKYGKKDFIKIQARLHEKYDFQKVQEILGQDYKEALRILEENGKG